jgi:signal transduction histidine kinase
VGSMPAVRERLARYLLLVDVLLVAAVLSASLPPLVNARNSGDEPSPNWAFGVVVLASLLLLLRRYRPTSVSLLVGVCSGVYGAANLPDPALPFAGLVATWSVAAYARKPLALLAGALTALGIAIALLLDQGTPTPQDWSINYLAFTTAWLLGWAARTSREITVALRQRAEQLERTQEAEARRAAVEERNRIAREMHDVVAHSLGLMIVQAEAGPVVVPRDPDRAVAVFDAISSTGKSALAEMRRLLGVLRDETTDDTPERAPQRGVDAIVDLVTSMREAGLDVHLEQSGPRRELPPSVDLSAYRIVQESLTNALKHAGPARVEVRVCFTDDVLDLLVRDDGLGAPGQRSADGKGLIGMRERVGLVGGRLSAGPADTGGWTVSASLPLAPAVRT